MALEQPFKGLSGLASKAKGEGKTRQPIGSKSFYFNELIKREVTRITKCEIVLLPYHDELLANGFVLLGSRLEGVGSDFSGEQVVGEIELYSGATAMPIAMSREGFGIGLWHGFGIALGMA